MSLVRLKPYDKSKGQLMKRYSVAAWRPKVVFEPGIWHDVNEDAAAYLATKRSHGGRDAPLAFDIVADRAAARRLIGEEKLAAMGRTVDHGKPAAAAVPDLIGHSVADDLNFDPTHDLELAESPVDALTKPRKKPAPKPKPKTKKKARGRRKR